MKASTRNTVYLVVLIIAAALFVVAAGNAFSEEPERILQVTSNSQKVEGCDYIVEISGEFASGYASEVSGQRFIWIEEQAWNNFKKAGMNVGANTILISSYTFNQRAVVYRGEAYYCY